MLYLWVAATRFAASKQAVSIKAINSTITQQQALASTLDEKDGTVILRQPELGEPSGCGADEGTQLAMAKTSSS